jgi:hypothetical protein
MVQEMHRQPAASPPEEVGNWPNLTTNLQFLFPAGAN